MTDKDQFIQLIKAAAIKLYPKYHIPCSISIAQACLESYYGKYDMGVHNLFGFKGTGPAGSVDKTTHEFDTKTQTYIKVVQKFRAYNSVEESLDDYQRNLSTNKAYKKAREYLTDPKNFAHKLTGVYATDPNYGDKLISLMDKYDLYQYDPFYKKGGSNEAPKN